MESKRRQSAFIEQMVTVVQTIGGNTVTEGAPTKEAGLRSYLEASSFARSGRVNIELKDEMEKREQLLPSHFTIAVLDEDSMDELKKPFSTTSPTETEATKNWAAFKSVQNFCREWGAKYEKERKELPSGTYVDTEILLGILKEYQVVI